MASNVFTLFLDRNTPELTNRFGTYLTGEFAMIPPEEVKVIASDLVTFFLGRILGTLSVESPLSQKIIAGTLQAGVSPEQMRRNIGEFFTILNELSTTDPALSKPEQAHVQRVLTQSQNFLALNVFLVNPKNLTDTNE